ncbi:MAG: hypothetical protein RR751_06665 [Clostridia bacterium]
MKIDWLIQKDGENTIGKKIEEAFAKKPEKVYMFLGTLKDDGFEILENGLVGSKAKVVVVTGYDRKNTTKIMLEGLLKYTDELYGYNNNKEVSLDANVILFKYKQAASVYVYSGNTSEGGIKDNISLYTHIIYDFEMLSDKEEYKKLIAQIKDFVADEKIVKIIDKAEITNLSNEKEIFTQKIYNHQVKSVAELLASHKSATKATKNEPLEEVPEIKDINLEDFAFSNIDIDFEEDEEIPVSIFDFEEDSSDIEIPEEEYASEKIVSESGYLDPDDVDVINLDDVVLEDDDLSDEVIDLESVIFSKPSMRMKRETVKELKDEKEKEAEREKKREEEKERKAVEGDVPSDEFLDQEIQLVSKKINLKNVSTLIMQLPKQMTKGKEKNCIKVPNYVKDLIPQFLDMTKASSVKVDKDKYKIKDIEIDIMDIEENVKYEDKEAKLSQKAGQTYIAFASDVIGNVEIEENSIARILKTGDGKYSIEIVPVNSNEYPIWKKVCNLTFRGSTRKYGVM